MKTQHVAIVGNPNCGKTTLFNILTSSQQTVGNWAGVTVDQKQGICHYQSQKLTITDLPGTYALTVTKAGSALDEKAVCEFVDNNGADLYINVIDAANLKRNLYLTVQLLEMGIPCIIALNMSDIATQRGIQIDPKRLGYELGCPVIPIVASKKQGITELCNAIISHKGDLAKPRYTLPLSQSLQSSLHSLEKTVMCCCQKNRIAARCLALRLLENDCLMRQLYDEPYVNESVKCIQKETLEETSEECDILIADARYQIVGKLFDTCTNTRHQTTRTLTDAVDRIVMHRWLGIPCFLIIMYCMFEFSITIGGLFQPLFDISSQVIFIDGIQYVGHSWHLPTWMTLVLAQGVGLGINTVVNFIPQIALMFLFLAFLEDSGYMARAAFVMDRFMQFVGLPGKSFVPLIIGFGCNVPAIMASRTLDSPRDRILTAIMSPFMSCGARLAIFIVFAQAFFPDHGGLVVFSLYLLGIVVAMLTGFLLKKTLLRGQGEPFILELPVYHKPTFMTIWRLTSQKLKRFIFRAGKVIIPMCVLIGTLNAVDLKGHIRPEGSDQSVLSVMSRQITPVFYPMGITQENWPATVGVITGFLAKEVVVGTLNTLYSQPMVNAYSPDHFHFAQGLKQSVTETLNGFANLFSIEKINPFTANEADHDMSTTAMHTMYAAFSSPVAAFAYLVFVLLYIPCASALGALMREIGNRWAMLATGWSVLIAYSLGVIGYQVSLLTVMPVSAISWIGGLVFINALFVWCLRYAGLKLNHDLIQIPAVHPAARS